MPEERQEEKALGLMKLGTEKPKAESTWANSDGQAQALFRGRHSQPATHPSNQTTDRSGPNRLDRLEQEFSSFPDFNPFGSLNPKKAYKFLIIILNV